MYCCKCYIFIFYGSFNYTNAKSLTPNWDLNSLLTILFSCVKEVGSYSVRMAGNGWSDRISRSTVGFSCDSGTGSVCWVLSCLDVGKPLSPAHVRRHNCSPCLSSCSWGAADKRGFPEIPREMPRQGGSSIRVWFPRPKHACDRARQRFPGARIQRQWAFRKVDIFSFALWCFSLSRLRPVLEM